MSVETFTYPPRVVAAFLRVWDSFARDDYVRQSADDLHLLHRHKLMLKRKATHDDRAEFEPGEWIFEFGQMAHRFAEHLKETTP